MEYTRINGYDENIAMLRRRFPVLTFAFDSLFKQSRYLDHFDHYNNKEMTDTSCVRARIHENTRHRACGCIQTKPDSQRTRDHLPSSWKVTRANNTL